MWSRLPLICFVLVCAFTWMACSSSSHAAAPSSSSSAAPTSSSDDLGHIRQLCEESNSALGAAARGAFGNQQPSTAQWQPFMVATVLPLIEQRLQAMSADPVSQAVAIKHAIDAGNAAVVSARNNPQQLSPSTRAPFDQYDDLVASAGIPGCAVGG